VCNRLYYLGLCKYTLWLSHNDEIALRRISQNVSPSLSDAYRYSKGAWANLRVQRGRVVRLPRPAVSRVR